MLADVEPVDLLVRGHPDSSETSFVTYQKTIERPKTIPAMSAPR